MTRLLDLGIDRIQNIIMDMAKLSEKSVTTAIESYEKGTSTKKVIFEWSEQLRVLQDEVSDLAIELIARYQPVATDLVDVLETMGSIATCDKSAVLEMSYTVREMITISVEALKSKDKDAAEKLYRMDDTVDALYRKYLREAISPREITDKQSFDPRCYISALLILRYLERISDHACYIGDSVHYIVTSTSSPRR